MTRRSFIRRAAGAAALTLAAVYAPSLKAVAVASRMPVAKETQYWITLGSPSLKAVRAFKRRATFCVEVPGEHKITGAFVGGSRGLHVELQNQFASWHASSNPPDCVKSHT